MVLTYIIIGLLALVALVAIVVAMQPSDFRVERTATMSAAPAAIFAEVNDLHRWQAWSPWEKIDPELKRTYEGPQAGVGASYAWVGNKNVGEGRMTIVESRPDEFIRIKLEFFKPFAATNTAEFAFRKVNDNQTTVTWTMFGCNNLMAKAFHLFINMDKMVGGQFAQGLANLKTVVESASADKSDFERTRIGL